MHIMKKLTRTGLLLICMASLSACSVVEEFNTKRYDRNNERGDAWLSDQMDPPTVDVSGTYRSKDWGRSFLAQSGRDVQGHIGDYPAKGIVSGDKVFLLVSEGGWYYYSAVLQMTHPGLLVGSYSRSIPYRRDFRRDMELVATQ